MESGGVRLRYIGPTLTGSAPDLGEYFERAAEFRRASELLFGGEHELEAQLVESLSALAGGRSVSAPLGPGGARYAPAGLRTILPGDKGLPIHCDSMYFSERSEYWHLSKLVDLGEELPFILPLTMSDCGGDLLLCALEWSEVEDRFRGISGRDQIPALLRRLREVFPDQDAYPSKLIRQEPGDLLLFDGSRVFHRVTPLTGARARCTFGGFFGLSRDRSKAYIWY